MQNTLCKKFKSPNLAEAHYFPDRFIASEPTVFCSELPVHTTITHQSDILTPDQELQLLSSAFQGYCSKYSRIKVEADFLKLCICAMENLKSSGRSNVIYNLCKALGTQRQDKSDSLLPVRRMPMGLIEHCATFFSSNSVSQVKMPWIMIILFLRWVCILLLFSGWLSI